MWYYIHILYIYNIFTRVCKNLKPCHISPQRALRLQAWRMSNKAPFDQAKQWSFYLGLGPGGKTGFRDLLIFSTFIVDVVDVDALNVLVTWFSASISVMSASGKMWSIWARPGNRRTWKDCIYASSFFHGRPIQRSMSLRSQTQSQCLCDPNRENVENSIDFFMSFLVYWYKKWSCWANRSFDESLERSPSDCGVFVRYTSGSTGPPKALVEEICAHESPMCRADEYCSFVQGVMLQHQQLVAFVGSCLQLSWSKHKSPQFVPNDNKLCCFALFCIVSLFFRICSEVIESCSYLILSSVVFYGAFAVPAWFVICSAMRFHSVLGGAGATKDCLHCRSKMSCCHAHCDALEDLIPSWVIFHWLTFWQ